MIINQRYAKQVEWRDGTVNEEVILIIIIPETKKETKEIHLLRWKIKNNFQSLLEWIAKTASSHAISQVKHVTPEEYKELKGRHA